MFDKSNLVSIGFWYYDGNIKSSVAIEKRATVDGTGDYEDEQNLQNGKVLSNYYIWFSTAGTEDFKNGAGYKLQLNEAKAEVYRLIGQKVNWIDL